MKRIILNFALIALIAGTAFSCKEKAEEAATTDAAEVSEAEVNSAKFMANTSDSTIEWKGFKPTGTHNGTIAIESGVFTVNDGKLESGTFLINMKSIAVLDIPAENEGNAKLVGHLTSADFFDVEKFPSAAFEVTGFESVDGKGMLSGNLTMKEMKNNVTFPVSMEMDGDNFTLTSETFTIDRSKWNVQYGSKSFFDDLGDKFINDDIELKITLKAKKS